MTALNGSLKLFSRLEKRSAAGFSTLALTPDQMAEPQRRLASLISSVKREVIGPIELARAIAWQLKFNPQMTSQRVLARTLGRDETWVSRILSFLRLPQDVQAIFAASQVLVSINAVAAIVHVKDADFQRQLALILAAGASTKAILGMIRAFEGKISPVELKTIHKSLHHAVVTIQMPRRPLSAQQRIEVMEDVAAREKAALAIDEQVERGNRLQMKANKNDLVRKIMRHVA